ncbi:MAG: large conductance mechanosensitive channel [Frankiales bacterium]|jgi:large conductance mechanosensitive channel|nr:large conductance mechanosensitive channel [Frankiales bacterium]
MSELLDGFKKFILRGNVVDLAVGIVIGAAFTLVVTSLVTNIITPVIAAIGGKPSFESLHFTVNHAVFGYGAVLTAIINFLIVAAAIYFLVVLPINALMARYKTEPDVDAPTKDCPECLSNIPASATRCAFCTVEQPAAA